MAGWVAEGSEGREGEASHPYPTFSGAGFAPDSLNGGLLAAPSAYRYDPLLAGLLPDGAMGMGGFELPAELVARLRLSQEQEAGGAAPDDGEADAPAAAPARPLQAGNADFRTAVGRAGEEFALHRLRANLAALATASAAAGVAAGDDGERPYVGCSAEWVNADGETGRPYDIELQREGKAVGFVEVKATTSLDAAHAFPFSVGEAAFAARHATTFHVCLVYGVDLHALAAGTTPPGLRTVLVQQAALQLNNAAAWPRFGLAVRAEGATGSGGSSAAAATAAL
jgi:hypothetical protein